MDSKHQGILIQLTFRILKFRHEKIFEDHFKVNKPTKSQTDNCYQGKKQSLVFLMRI
jgi:hypothetical protein